jgi:hypothetical protein
MKSVATHITIPEELLKEMDDDPELVNVKCALEIAQIDEETKLEKKLAFKVKSIEDKLALGAALIGMRKKLQVGQRILLGVSWCHEQERRLFDLYPEVLMFDCTFGTNNENRPLAVTSSPDGNMEVFTYLAVHRAVHARGCLHRLHTAKHLTGDKGVTHLGRGCEG